MNTYFSLFLDELIVEPEKLIKNGVMEMGLYDLEPSCCLRKASLLKLNERYGILLRLKKNYSRKIFVEK